MNGAGRVDEASHTPPQRPDIASGSRRGRHIGPAVAKVYPAGPRPFSTMCSKAGTLWATPSLSTICTLRSP